MFKMIDGLPDSVLGVEAVGQVTHDDYQSVLIPLAEDKLKNGPLKMLYVIGSDFTGYELGALWDDTGFGLKHWNDFSHIAFVTDHAWMKGAVSMFVPFFPGEVKIFPLGELDDAKSWLES